MRQHVKWMGTITLAVALAFSSAACASQTVAEETKMTSQAVKSGDLLIGLYADARISTPVTGLDFALSGTLTELAVAEGQHVAAGEVLARMDPTDFQAEMTAARLAVDKAQAAYNEAVKARNYSISTEQIKLIAAQRSYFESQQEAIEAYNAQILKIDYLKNNDTAVASAEIALEDAEEGTDEYAIAKAQQTLADAISDRDYNIALEEQKLIPIQKAYLEVQAELAKDPAIYTSERQNLDLQQLKLDYVTSSDASVTTAKYALDDAKAKLSALEADGDPTLIIAPVAGTVVNLAAAVGDQIVGKSLTQTSGTAAAASLVVLRKDGPATLTAYVAEADVVDLARDQIVKVSIDALGVENLAGRVTDINPIAKVDSTGIVTYQVTGTLDQADDRIFDGMTAFAIFVKKEKQDVLLVSNKAIFIEENQQYVWVLKEDGSTEKRAITAGLTNGTQSEVTEGLTAGEKVVTGGLPQ